MDHRIVWMRSVSAWNLKAPFFQRELNPYVFFSWTVICDPYWKAVVFFRKNVVLIKLRFNIRFNNICINRVLHRERLKQIAPRLVIDPDLTGIFSDVGIRDITNSVPPERKMSVVVDHCLDCNIEPVVFVAWIGHRDHGNSRMLFPIGRESLPLIHPLRLIRLRSFRRPLIHVHYSCLNRLRILFKTNHDTKRRRRIFFAGNR